MSADPRDPNAAAPALPLHVRVAAEDARGRARLSAAIDDFFIPEPDRLDDRLRAAIGALLRALVATVEAEIRQHAGRLLADSETGALGNELRASTDSVADRLIRAGLLRDPDLMAELFARAETDRLSTALPGHGSDDLERPSLLPRLIGDPDRVVASAAMLLLIAESRTGIDSSGLLARTDLPAELHHRLVWWITAAIRDDHLAAAGEHVSALDRALAQAAMRSLAAHDEGERALAAASRLAAALDPRPDEVPGLLLEALADRRVTLFIAAIAQAGGFDVEIVRDIVLDAAGSRLWLVLRALGCNRIALAQIAEALAAGDRRRDLDRLSDEIERAGLLGVETAAAAVAALRLHRDYRTALRDLGSGQ